MALVIGEKLQFESMLFLVVIVVPCSKYYNRRDSHLIYIEAPMRVFVFAFFFVLFLMKFECGMQLVYKEVCSS